MTLKPPPTQASFIPMAFTGIASSSIGDKVGDALSIVLTWLLQLLCNCTIPDMVVSAFHTLCVAVTVFLAFVVHYYIIKPKGDTQ